MRKKNDEYDTVHTLLSYWLVVIALGVQTYLGVTYIRSEIPYDHLFGVITTMEAVFALFGFFLIDPISGYGFKLYPKRFRPINDMTGIHFIITFAGLLAAQYALGQPLTVRDFHKAAAIAFAAPAEEIMFRGLLVTIFMQISMISSFTRFKVSEKRSIGIFDVFGIIISSLLFMSIHINYYDNPRLMATVYLCGTVLAVSYWAFRDITACILAHMFLNMIVVYQVFFMVNF